MSETQKINDSQWNDWYPVAGTFSSEVEKVIVGKHREVTLLLTALFAGGHVLIEDVPGVGKTTLASTLAKAAGLKFHRAQFTPDVMASDITGFNIYNRQTERFEFREGLVMCNILLADEINRASPKTQSSLLESMEEHTVTVDGTTYPIPDPFMVIATQNPSGYVGTYPLPEAQLDRFCLKLSMGYPSEEEELRILTARRSSNPLEDVRAVVSLDQIRTLRSLCREVSVDENVYRYIISLISATRTHGSLALGASPRATLMLSRMCQAYAFLAGRNYVLPEDVSALFCPVVAHRVILRQEAKLNRRTAEDILDEVLHSVEVPYQAKKK